MTLSKTEKPNETAGDTQKRAASADRPRERVAATVGASNE